jgi:2-alkenal reductase
VTPRIFMIGIVSLLAGIIVRPYLGNEFLSAISERAAVSGNSNSLAEIERSIIDLFERVSPSVVEITTMSKGNEAGSRIKTGSGFFWDPAGNIVTNEHVVSDQQMIEIWLASGEMIPGELVGAAPTYDLAVIRAKGLKATPRPVTVGTSRGLKVGQWAFAIGSPFGLDQSLTAGVISAMKRQLPTSKGREIEDIIQTDAAIYPGSSGGPLLNSIGELIGITSVSYSIAGAGNALGFAIPVDIVKRVIPLLIKDGRIPTPGIGIVPSNVDVAIRLGVEGIIIARIRSGSPAERAGLRAMDKNTGEVGDIITAANGKPVKTPFDLTNELDRIGIGHKIALNIQRGGTVASVELEIIDISSKP